MDMKLDSFKSLAYNAVYATRHFNLVVVNILLTSGSPFTGISRSWHLQKIFCLIVIQIIYLSYIHITRPHDQSLFNILEFINEYSLLGLAYLMINFTTIPAYRDPKTNKVVPKSKEFEDSVELIGIAIIAFIVVVNFGVMVTLFVNRVIQKIKQKKAQMQSLKVSTKRKLLKSLKSFERKSTPVKKPELSMIEEDEGEDYKDSEVNADLSEIHVEEPLIEQPSDKVKKKKKLNRFKREKQPRYKHERHYPMLFSSTQPKLIKSDEN